MNETITRVGDRTSLRMERHFPHPRQKVWRAVSDPAQLSAWWPFRIRELPLVVGATLRFFDGDDVVSTAIVTAVEVERRLSFQETADGEVHDVEIELVDYDGGCLLVFTHAFQRGAPASQHATGWHHCFEVLDATLGGRAPPTWVPRPDRRAHYEALFGET